MKATFLPTLALILLTTPGFSQQSTSNPSAFKNNQLLNKSKALPAGVEENWYNEAVANIEAAQYKFHAYSGNFIAVNDANKIQSTISASGYTLKSVVSKNQNSNWQTSFTLLNISRDKYSWEPEKSSATVSNEKLTYSNKTLMLSL